MRLDFTEAALNSFAAVEGMKYLVRENVQIGQMALACSSKVGFFSI
jgi:hypothetical protein